MIFLLTRADRVRFDEFIAKVVRASNEDEARRIANHTVGDEGRSWDDQTIVKCELVTEDGPPKEILGSFNAG